MSSSEERRTGRLVGAGLVASVVGSVGAVIAFWVDGLVSHWIARQAHSLFSENLLTLSIHVPKWGPRAPSGPAGMSA